MLTFDDPAPLPAHSLGHMPGIVAWPEFARNVGPGLSTESHTGGRGTATGMENPLRDSASRCMPR